MLKQQDDLDEQQKVIDTAEDEYETLDTLGEQLESQILNVK